MYRITDHSHRHMSINDALRELAWVESTPSPGVVPVELAPQTREDILAEHHQVLENAARIHRYRLEDLDKQYYEGVAQERKRLQWLLDDLTSSYTLPTRPWMWIYLRGTHPHSHWGPPPCLVTDFIAQDLHTFRHGRKLRYQRKKIPHVKRGFSWFNHSSSIVAHLDWSRGRYA